MFSKTERSSAIIWLWLVAGFSYFLRMLGPALGFALASFCLNMYISPTLTPTIDKQDPRWLGAWWIGWILLGVLLMVFGSVLGLFPKVLPKAAARKAAASERAKFQKLNDVNKQQEAEPELPASLSGSVLRTGEKVFFWFHLNEAYIAWF